MISANFSPSIGNRLLPNNPPPFRALVAVVLKVGPSAPEYAGKMDFYLNLPNEKERASRRPPLHRDHTLLGRSPFVIYYPLCYTFVLHKPVQHPRKITPSGYRHGHR